MQKNNIKKQFLSGMIWRFAERCGAQGVQFVVSIILARMLTPTDYGIIGLITVFISIANVFAQSGFGQSLIQKKDSDDVDFSSVFYFSIGMSLVVYAALYLAAPWLAAFYEQPLLTDVVRVLGITVIIGSANSVQQAYVSKTMQFKRFFFATLAGTIASAAVGIVMAYMGCGVWSLVGQQISNQLINTVVLWFTVGWRPKLCFSFKRMGRLFSYGWKLLCSSLLDTAYNNIYSLIIGKFYSTEDLGFYNKGKQFPMLIIQNVNTAIDSVLFPVLSEVQDERERLKSMVRRSIITSTFIIFPAMAGLAAVARPFVLLLLTEKWLPAVIFIQFCCFTYAFWPVHTANLQAIKAVGESGIFLKLEIIKKILGITVLIITLPYGLNVMMFGRCCATVISSFINAAPNKKLLGYSYIEQVKDMLPSMLLSVAMFGVVLLVGNLQLPLLLLITVQIVVGGVFYIGCARLFNFECLNYMIDTIKKFKKSK